MVAKGEFREDLLYRINTIHVEIPPLRERKEDIIPLVERFMVHFCKQYDKSLMKFTPEAKDKLTAHPWYGNIRELEHVIEKAVIINDSPLIPAELFQLSVPRIAIRGTEYLHPGRNGSADDTESARCLCGKSIGSTRSTGNNPADAL